MTTTMTKSFIEQVGERLLALIEPGAQRVSAQLDTIRDSRNRHQEIELSGAEVYTLLAVLLPSLFNGNEDAISEQLSEFMTSMITYPLANLMFQYGYFSALADADAPVPLEAWRKRSGS